MDLQTPTAKARPVMTTAPSLVTRRWGRVPSVHGTCYPALAWPINLQAYAMPSVPVPPITLTWGFSGGGARMPARSVCPVTLSLSEAGPGRFGGQASVTDIYHAMPCHVLVRVRGRATGLVFASCPKDRFAKQGRRGGFHCYRSNSHLSFLRSAMLHVGEVMAFRLFRATGLAFTCVHVHIQSLVQCQFTSTQKRQRFCSVQHRVVDSVKQRANATPLRATDSAILAGFNGAYALTFGGGMCYPPHGH